MEKPLQTRQGTFGLYNVIGLQFKTGWHTTSWKQSSGGRNEYWVRDGNFYGARLEFRTTPPNNQLQIDGEAEVRADEREAILRAIAEWDPQH